MSMNNQGRPSRATSTQDNDPPTISGDRGLDLEARLIFEIGRDGVTGVDLPDVKVGDDRLLGGFAARPPSAFRASANRK